MKTKTICFVAGHSGGHIIPCATQAKKELEINNKYKLLFISTNNQLDKKILNNYDFIDQKIYLPITNLSKNPIKFIKLCFNLVLSFFKSYKLLKELKPEKIVSMGGLISIPVCLAGRFLKIPIELWELNVEPGKAIKFLSNFTNNLNICFDQTKKYFPAKLCSTVNYPVRFSENIKNISRENILNKINFSIKRKTILIIGGSQGSQFINNQIKEFIEQNELIKNKIQIIHQTGITDFDWKDFYNQNQISAITFAFHDQIEDFYIAADLIICRSGAGTLAEILFFQKKCITIPLETKSTSHQILNAQSLSKKYPNLFYLINQKEIEENRELFFNEIKKLANIPIY